MIVWPLSQVRLCLSSFARHDRFFAERCAPPVPGRRTDATHGSSGCVVELWIVKMCRDVSNVVRASSSFLSGDDRGTPQNATAAAFNHGGDGSVQSPGSQKARCQAAVLLPRVECVLEACMLRALASYLLQHNFGVWPTNVGKNQCWPREMEAASACETGCSDMNLMILSSFLAVACILAITCVAAMILSQEIMAFCVLRCGPALLASGIQ